jgi:hypothetical protein
MDLEKDYREGFAAGAAAFRSTQNSGRAQNESAKGPCGSSAEFDTWLEGAMTRSANLLLSPPLPTASKHQLRLPQPFLWC